MPHRLLIATITLLPFLATAQITEAYDDFEGNTNIPVWSPDDCGLNTEFANPVPGGSNSSATVLRYHDTGGQYANVRFDMNDQFDLSVSNTFSLQIYIPSDGLTGNQPNQVSLKLQDGRLDQPWVTQSEIIKPVTLDEWQTVTFDFANDDYRNLDAGSLPPVERTDFNRVLIQVNGENNNDHVVAYVDDIQLYATEMEETNVPVFDQLVWSDEFDTDGAIDSEKWFHQTIIPNGESWFNGEIQHYTDELANAYVANGALHLVAKKETYTDQGVTKFYTSARLNSKFAFTYGRVDIRAKLPTGVGTWPALWMLGKNIDENGAYWETQGYGTTSWPQCGEIDIMEHWGDNQDYVSSAIHTPSSFGGTVNHGGRVLPNASTEFHTYSVVWTEEKITFSVDGVPHYTYAPDVRNADTWPFDAEQYILFNVAILPNIDANFTESAMEIDYIRIYQKSTVTSLEQIQENPGKVFPNPFDQTLNLVTDNPSDQIGTIYLFNAYGMLVNAYPTAGNYGRVTLENTWSLPVGVYFLQYTVNGKMYVRKVVKE
jgi:beta-glucanase (GH16 family)